MLLIPSGRGEAGTLPVMAFKDGKPFRRFGRDHCKKFPGIESISAALTAPIPAPPPPVAFPFPIPLGALLRNGIIGVESAFLPVKNISGAV